MSLSLCMVGIGGAGGKVLDHMAGFLADSPPLIAINTDSRALEECRATTKLQIGIDRTGGLGAGGDSELGRQSALDDIDMIRSLFADMQIVFLITGLGGGTGSGAAPVVLEAAQQAGALTICFAALPFEFEGKPRRELAEQTVLALRQSADALVVIPNDRLSEHAGSGRVADTFWKADEILSHAVCAIFQMITKPGYISLGLADLQRIVRSCEGVCTLGYGEGEGADRAAAAVKALMESPLVQNGASISVANALLVSIVGGRDLALKEVGDIMKAIGARVRPDAPVSMGTVLDEAWNNRIGITLVAAEEWMPAIEMKGTAPKNDARTTDSQAEPGLLSSGRWRPTQTSFRLEASGKGRFKNVEPTILDGEDFDVPAYIRRGISIE